MRKGGQREGESERWRVAHTCIWFVSWIVCAQTSVVGAVVSPFASILSPIFYRLVGLVVKASTSRAEGPGFESRLRRDFFGVESYQ